jgi:hypothetical protein
VLGFGDLTIPSGRAWHVDATSGRSFGAKYFRAIDYLDLATPSDVKVVWELSRMQWLPWLAEAAVAFEGSETAEHAVAMFEDLLCDWDASNPVGYGPNWVVGMEVGIRALNLFVGAALLWPVLSARSRAVAGGLFRDSATYLRWFSEISDVPGNHYLICVLGRMLLEGVVAGRRERRAQARWRSWQLRMAEQFESDGLHREHAPLYHRLCTEAAVWGLVLAEVSDVEPEGALLDATGAAISALALLEVGGELPVIGDSDSGTLLPLGKARNDLEVFRRLLGSSSAGPPLWRALAPHVSAHIADRMTCAAGNPATLARTSRVGPFVVLRSARATCAVRVGNHGLAGRASHDHDDVLSPWIGIGNLQLIVDAGCSSYTRSKTSRLRELGSASHNLIISGQANRFRFQTGSISPTVADAPVARLVETTGCTVVAEASWYDECLGTITHRRKIELPYSDLLCAVEDSIESERAGEVSISWHLAAPWSMDETPMHAGIVCVRHRTEAVRVWIESRLDCTTTRSGGTVLHLAPLAYQHAPLYGSTLQATVLTGKFMHSGRSSVRTDFMDVP